jgi:hypothetical protein
MKYIIDLDALKECLELIPILTRINGISCVNFDDVISMIDRFPKEECDLKE